MYILCGVQENGPLKFPAVETIIEQKPQLLCSRIHLCNFAETPTPSYSQLRTKQDKIPKAYPFLKDAGLL